MEVFIIQRLQQPACNTINPHEWKFTVLQCNRQGCVAFCILAMPCIILQSLHAAKKKERSIIILDHNLHTMYFCFLDSSTSFYIYQYIMITENAQKWMPEKIHRFLTLCIQETSSFGSKVVYFDLNVHIMAHFVHTPKCNSWLWVAGNKTSCKCIVTWIFLHWKRFTEGIVLQEILRANELSWDFSFRATHILIKIKFDFYATFHLNIDSISPNHSEHQTFQRLQVRWICPSLLAHHWYARPSMVPNPNAWIPPFWHSKWIATKHAYAPKKIQLPHHEKWTSPSNTQSQHIWNHPWMQWLCNLSHHKQ